MHEVNPTIARPGDHSPSVEAICLTDLLTPKENPLIIRDYLLEFVRNDQLIPRIVRNVGGDPVIQMREGVHFLQMNTSGNPNGCGVPHNGSYLKYFQKMEQSTAIGQTSLAELPIESEKWQRLQKEASQYVQRAKAFRQLDMPLRCKKDLAHAGECLRIIRDHIPGDLFSPDTHILIETTMYLTTWAEAELFIRTAQAVNAKKTLTEGIGAIRSYCEMEESAAVESQIQSLSDLRQEIHEKRHSAQLCLEKYAFYRNEPQSLEPISVRERGIDISARLHGIFPLSAHNSRGEVISIISEDGSDLLLSPTDLGADLLPAFGPINAEDESILESTLSPEREHICEDADTLSREECLKHLYQGIAYADRMISQFGVGDLDQAHLDYHAAAKRFNCVRTLAPHAHERMWASFSQFRLIQEFFMTSAEICKQSGELAQANRYLQIGLEELELILDNDFEVSLSPLADQLRQELLQANAKVSA